MSYETKSILQIKSIVDELNFYCPSETSDFYFEGTINGDFFCYYDEIDRYEQEFSVTSTFTTSGPSVSIGDGIEAGVTNFRVWANLGFTPVPELIPNAPGHQETIAYPHLKHYLLIETPSDTVQRSFTELIEKNITQIGDLVIQSDVVDFLDGFNISFNFNDYDNLASQKFETLGGNQDGSFLKITNLEIKNFPLAGIKQYNVTFEFECNLYYYNNPNKFYNKIENGVMKLKFEI